jgi:serine/threonine protein kinase
MVNGNMVSAEVRRRNNMTPGRNNENSSIAGDEEFEASICAGTPMYQSPEQTMQQIQIKKNNNEAICLTDKVDMFAAGLILYEMCSSFKTAH